MTPVWKQGDYVRVMRMKPSFQGKDGLVAGQLQDLFMTVKSVNAQGIITSIGAYGVKYLRVVDSMWGVFRCPKLDQKILVWIKDLMLKALGKKIVVIPEEMPPKSSSGLILPESMKVVKLTASVVSVGPKAAGSVSVGDRIVFEDNSGARVKQEGISYIILDLSEVLGKETA